MKTHAGHRSIASLTALVAVLCFAPLILLAALAGGVLEGAVRREVSRQVETTAAVSASLVAEQLHGVSDLVESYAGRHQLREALAAGPTAADHHAVAALLEPILSARAGIVGVFVTDLDGVLTDALPETRGIVGRNSSFRDWYVGLTTTGATYVSEAYETELGDRARVVGVATFVQDSNDRNVAILAVVYSVDAIDQTVDKLTTDQQVQLTVTDQRGVVLAEPGPSSVTGLKSLRSDKLVAAALAGQSGITTSDSPQGKTLAAYVPIPQLGWAVTTEIPEDTVFASVRTVRNTVWVLSGALAVAILGGLCVLVVALKRGRRVQTQLGFRAEHESGLRRYIETGQGSVIGRRIQIPALHRDGREIPVELSVFVTTVDGRPCFNAFIHDQAERQQQAEALATARDQALDASRMKSEFLANNRRAHSPGHARRLANPHRRRSTVSNWHASSPPMRRADPRAL